MNTYNKVVLIILGFIVISLLFINFKINEIKDEKFIRYFMIDNSIKFDESIPREFLHALIEVESSHNPNAVGDDGKAIGILQIHKIYVDDVNRIAGTHYSYDDRKDPSKSIEMTLIYLKHYGRNYELLTGNKMTYEVLARIHNGGPAGWMKKSTIDYWKKVEKVLLEDIPL